MKPALQQEFLIGLVQALQMMSVLKLLTLLEIGLFQELNRLCLHPAGLDLILELMKTSRVLTY